MSQFAIAFALLTAALTQAIIPTTAWTGWAPTPTLCGLVLYYALVRSRGLILEVAVLAGLVEDSLSLVPLGTSSFAYAVAGLAIERVRDDVVVRQWTTHVVFGALLNLAVTVFALLILLKDGLIAPPPAHVALRLAGSLALGGAVAPIVFHLMLALEAWLGLTEAETEAE
jgi:rod shape-determining protein MreD